MMSQQSPDFIYNADSFADVDLKPHVTVPICRATPETLIGYGRLVDDFNLEQVERVTWPKTTGWRSVAKGTGNQQTLIDDKFLIFWKGDIVYGSNVGFGEIGQNFATGRLSRDGHYVLVRDANYHPDGGQLFFPTVSDSGPVPFVMLMAPSSVGDDVTPQDFRAFWFDGRQGFEIAPNVWHQSPYVRPPTETGSDVTVATTTFLNKQSSVFACVLTDTVTEFGVFLKVPLELIDD